MALSCPWGQGTLWCGCPAGMGQAPRAAGSSGVHSLEKGKSRLLPAACSSQVSHIPISRGEESQQQSGFCCLPTASSGDVRGQEELPV